LQALAELDADALSPREALEQLYRLKSLWRLSHASRSSSLPPMTSLNAAGSTAGPAGGPAAAAGSRCGRTACRAGPSAGGFSERSAGAARAGGWPSWPAPGAHPEPVQQVFERHETSGGRGALVASLTDMVMTGIHAYTEASLPPAPAEKPWALAAPAAYGARRARPYSTSPALPQRRADGSRGKRAVEFMLYLLWDLGLKVGHATRSRADCIVDAKGDATVLTTLLDARHIAGEAAVFQRFAADFRAARAEWGLKPFLAAKRAERQQRHARYGESPFLVEPHVKEGRGGLRDLQTLYGSPLRASTAAHARAWWAGQPRRGCSCRSRRAPSAAPGNSSGPSASICILVTRPRRGAPTFDPPALGGPPMGYTRRAAGRVSAS